MGAGLHYIYIEALYIVWALWRKNACSHCLCRPPSYPVVATPLPPGRNTQRIQDRIQYACIVRVRVRVCVCARVRLRRSTFFLMSAVFLTSAVFLAVFSMSAVFLTSAVFSSSFLDERSFLENCGSTVSNCVRVRVHVHATAPKGCLRTGEG